MDLSWNIIWASIIILFNTQFVELIQIEIISNSNGFCTYCFFFTDFKAVGEKWRETEMDKEFYCGDLPGATSYCTECVTDSAFV